MNPLITLQKFGQSPWYDYILRDLILSGELTTLIENDGLLGMTSNPSIFEKAIGGSAEYDSRLKEIAPLPIGVKEIYETLAIRDIQDAADLFFPVYEKTNGKDGYVSLEVSPDLAYDTQGTILEALRLFKTVGRRNIMIKVPGTEEGLPAIERLISEGLNINVTLLFSVARYEEVALAYLSGLQRRVKAGLPIHQIASVASFFVSRIDTLIDAQLESMSTATTDPAAKEQYQFLLGKTAIANAKMAYLKFQEIGQSASFLALAQKGASPQRLLWASTSVKNPKYRDTYYVEALIGKETVNTMPIATFDAFRDHGIVYDTLSADLAQARSILTLLSDAGIDLSEVTNKLLSDGVLLFADSFNQLMATINKKRKAFVGSPIYITSASLGPFQSPVLDAVMKIKKDQIIPRIWKKDPTVWQKDAATRIPLLLGWLHVIEKQIEELHATDLFVQSIQAHFKHAVLLGMGGSSLCPKVLRAIHGISLGFPELHVLDTILPSQIRSLERHLPLSETVFIVSSKSGSTIEPITLCQYFFNEFARAKGNSAGEHFIAITDPGSPLTQYAEKNKFRKIFAGVPDIGGRYSALSPFGIIPAAIMGVDIKSLLYEAKAMRYACDPYMPSEENPAVQIGAVLGQLAMMGRNKLTFITSPALAPFEIWLEQLIAESTGKAGVGIVPMVHEPLGSPDLYGADRLFVYIRYRKETDQAQESQVSALEKTGHPVLTLEINNLIEIGGQFFLWEMATAVAGSILNINPFDQPDVEGSKKNSRTLLERYESGREEGLLPKERPIFIEEGVSVYSSRKGMGASTLKEMISTEMSHIQEKDYVSINAYLPETDHLVYENLRSIRTILREKAQVATTLCYGPSYLHSTGQLHKGGPNTVLLFIITAEAIPRGHIEGETGASGEAESGWIRHPVPAGFARPLRNQHGSTHAPILEDLPIPGKAYTFGNLALAQAIGDFQSLCQHQRRVVWIHLGTDVYKGLHHLVEAFRSA